MMKPYLAIVRVEDGRVAMYMDFETMAEAEAHVAEHGGFAVETSIPVPRIFVGANNAISDVAPPAPVPQSVSAYQARMALLAAGLLDDVEALMADPQTDRAARIAWEYGTTVERSSPLISALAPSLGMTDEQIDDLFRAARSIA